MSKLLSEEQIFEAFMSHIENVRHTSLRKHLASPSLEIYVNQFLKSEYNAFKSAFNLLMPIIEKQADELEYYSKEENWSYPMGYGMNKTNICVMDTDEFYCGGKRARQALQETKQMLEQLGAING